MWEDDDEVNSIMNAIPENLFLPSTDHEPITSALSTNHEPITSALSEKDDVSSQRPHSPENIPKQVLLAPPPPPSTSARSKLRGNRLSRPGKSSDSMQLPPSPSRTSKPFGSRAESAGPSRSSVVSSSHEHRSRRCTSEDNRKRQIDEEDDDFEPEKKRKKIKKASAPREMFSQIDVITSGNAIFRRCHFDDRERRRMNLLGCIVCYKLYETEEELLVCLKKELSAHHGSLHACEEPNCLHSFVTKRGLEDHQGLHDRNRMHQCGLCFLRFIKNSNLTEHMLSHFQRLDFKCGNCDFECNCERNLDQHVASFHRKICFSCDLCIFSSPYKKVVVNHFATNHPEVKEHRISSRFLEDDKENEDQEDDEEEEEQDDRQDPAKETDFPIAEFPSLETLSGPLVQEQLQPGLGSLSAVVVEGIPIPVVAGNGCPQIADSTLLGGGDESDPPDHPFIPWVKDPSARDNWKQKPFASPELSLFCVLLFPIYLAFAYVRSFRNFCQGKIVESGNQSATKLVYLLLDPTRLGGWISPTFYVFVTAIFYIGKGFFDRPCDHITDALKFIARPIPDGDDKRVVTKIKELLLSGTGPIMVFAYYHATEYEVRIIESILIESIGFHTKMLKNLIVSFLCKPFEDYYHEQRRNMIAVSVLQLAYLSFQMYPSPVMNLKYLKPRLELIRQAKIAKMLAISKKKTHSAQEEMEKKRHFDEITEEIANLNKYIDN